MRLACETKMDGKPRQNLFEEIIARTTDAVIAIDSEQRIVLFNEAASTMFRVRGQEAMGQSLARFIPERFRQTHAGKVAEFGRTGASKLWMGGGFSTVPGMRANGEEFPAEMSISRVEADGQVFYTAIVRDISERRRAEESLQQTGQRLALALQTARLGMYERDLRTNKIDLNDICREILGIGEGDPPADVAVRSVHPEDKERVMASVGRAFDPGIREVCRAEFRILRPDGTIRWVEGRGRVIFDETFAPARPQKFLGVLLDITEHKLIEAKLTSAKEAVSFINSQLEQRVIERTTKLQETMAELEHMSYSMIHDMRAPLRAVQSFGAILERDPQFHLSEEAIELLRKMQTAAGRMDELLTGVLNYNGALRGSLPVGPANVQRILQDLLELYPEFRPSRVDIAVKGRFPWVTGNEAALTQCFAELLRNAIKFVEPGTMPRIRVWAERVQDPHQPKYKVLRGNGVPPSSAAICDWVRIWFEDNGTGIPAMNRRRIFNLFERMHGPEYPGTGVGLALVRKLIEQMGGVLGVESKVGKGSRFWLELPCPCHEQQSGASLAA